MSDSGKDEYTTAISLLAVRGIRTKRAEEQDARAAQQAEAAPPYYPPPSAYSQPFAAPDYGQAAGGQPPFPRFAQRGPTDQWAPPVPLVTSPPRNAA